LPDGKQITIREEAWKGPEILFNPSIIGTFPYSKTFKTFINLNLKIK